LLVRFLKRRYLDHDQHKSGLAKMRPTELLLKTDHMATALLFLALRPDGRRPKPVKRNRLLGF
jgi:hypothetical protein